MARRKVATPAASSDLTHTYSPSVFCAACDAGFPKGCKTGCHRLDPATTGSKYDDDAASQTNRQSTTQATPDPFSGN